VQSTSGFGCHLQLSWKQLQVLTYSRKKKVSLTQKFKFRPMKKIIVLFLVASFALLSCKEQKKETSRFDVFVNISDFDGYYVKLQRRVLDTWQVVDSAIVEAGTAKLSGELDYPEMLNLAMQGVNGTVPFFVESGEITIQLNPNDLRNAAISGSAIHQRYLDFLDEFANYDEQLFQLYQAYRSAVETNDPAAMTAAEEAYVLAEKEKKQFLVNYIMTNNKDVVTHFIMHRNSYQFDVEELEAMVVNLDPDVKSVYFDALRDRVLVWKSVAIGMPFKDFEQADPNDSLISLSSKIGVKLLLVDFWASWCGPCRDENPNIVAIFNDYKSKGFDVFGVSFDSNYDKWLEAIAADKLSWTHVSDLKGWGNEAGKLYGVQAIPHSVLIDENGIIIAKNLKGDKLREKVAELLK